MRIYTEEKTIKKSSNHNENHVLNSTTTPSTMIKTTSTTPSTKTLTINNNNNNNNVFNKNPGQISMYRFINTKGKKTNKFFVNGNGNGNVNGMGNRNNINNNNNNNINNLNHNLYFDNSNDYDYFRPLSTQSSSSSSLSSLSISKKYIVCKNNRFSKKRIPFIDKIQEELREMKLREDELRCQRINVGISCQNLNSICDDDFTSESSEENKDSFHSRCSSNPDFSNSNGISTSSSPSPPSSSSSTSSYTLANVDLIVPPSSSSTTTITDQTDSTIDCGLKIGGPRRKIPLIALWEKKINECQNKIDTSTTSTTKETTPTTTENNINN